MVAAVVLDELKYLFQFLTLQFWKEQLLIFSDNVSSLSHPDPTVSPQQQCVLQLVQSLHNDSNPTECVIRLLVNILTAEDMKRSAVTLVQRLYGKSIRKHAFVHYEYTYVRYAVIVMCVCTYVRTYSTSIKFCSYKLCGICHFFRCDYSKIPTQMF